MPDDASAQSLRASPLDRVLPGLEREFLSVRM